MAQQEEDPASTGKDHQKRGPDGSSGCTINSCALGVQGGLCLRAQAQASAEKPPAKNSVDRSTRNSRPLVSSCPKESHREFLQLTRGSLQGGEGRAPASARVPRRSPRGSPSEGARPPPCAARVASQSNSRPDRPAEATRGRNEPGRTAPLVGQSQAGKTQVSSAAAQARGAMRLPHP